MRITVPTYRPTASAAPSAVTYSLFPITYSINVAFSAKERDVETGLSYFGARYYSSDLSIWLSVDPMSDKYPSLSPYVYCADNPVKLVDPNGEEVGDYYYIDGTYLGTDNKDDGMVYIISNFSDKSSIEANKTDDVIDPTILGKVTPEQITTYAELEKSINIFNTGEDCMENGGAYENTGKWREGIPGKHTVILPISTGMTSIHKHSWKCEEESNKQYYSPEYPSPEDYKTFKDFDRNIIVGKTGGTYDYTFQEFHNRKDALCFYGNKSTKCQCMISLNVAKSIVENGKKLSRNFQPPHK